MARCAAKNHERVTIVVDPADYESVITEFDALGDTRPETRLRLAQKAFKASLRHDQAILDFLEKADRSETQTL